ncbi:acetyltransferase [Kitasatospora sp. MMS16-BH015]|uniref:GNAT family N-acetyltransferase n=1 Tax=Kitasatospora sp. MMS16-BH015 TaxID=2018025 RepID=UPI000CA2E9B8|nr:GNAT family N-acetyltransferase [Kitasatospora sp. MMS16-BH015]AUG80508.1 acetyltransferase [Kitasatospora sp. MMS16-BH015]
MADWELRPASPAHVELLAELRAETLRADLERLGVYDEHQVRQRLRDKYEPEHTWLIEVAGEFAGSVALRPAEDAHWLEHFYLAAAHQGRGIGGAVLARLLEDCDRAGHRVKLQMLQGSSAITLYQRAGFTVEHESWSDVFMVREAA